MDLIKDIKKDILDDNISLSSVLRKAKVLSRSLKSEEFKKWVDSELYGYTGKIEIPAYRKMVAQNFGVFTGPFGSMVKNAMIPTFNLPETVKDFAEEIQFPQGVKELEEMMSSDSETLQRKWIPEAVMFARDSIQMSGNMVLVDAWQLITKQMIAGVLDSIKNRLLDFLLDLQEAEPQLTESEDSIQEIPKETVKSIFNFNVYGNHNVVASGENITQDVNQEINQNDIETLLRYLKNLNVCEEDLDELKEAISKDGERKDKKFGNRVKEWIGGMMVKAAQGIWKIGQQTVPSLLTSALSHYYGWK